ncbi:CaiB/BaiF CoA transferase family protein [Staphylospora marina]|uniref:CaiB/BaiF CoA transferase family protein n=1 Tax=Staphylospora marina TaxID=2490858 RepID=UPI000F5B92D4|nr:CaiB/BaiF CoA-transferase family protein [Staphylospora marina]
MLTGIRVLDFTVYFPGPVATGRLAAMGAEVVKVEPPKGDPARHAGEQSGGIGILFSANNRGKKSVRIDLKQEAGRRLALRLAERADVLLESFRPGVMDKLGLGYEQVSAVNPGIVYGSLTGFGRTGPLSRLASHDLNYQALSGLLSLLTADGSPGLPAVQLVDLVGGLAASERILAALMERGKTGRGSRLDISMLDEAFRLLHTHREIQAVSGSGRGLSLLSGGAVAYGVYETKDGGHVALAAVEPVFWRRFCEAVGRPDWISHGWSPQTKDNPVYRELCELFRERTRAEWASLGLRVDCCLSPVLEVGELFRYPPFSEQPPRVPEASLPPAPAVPGQDAETVLREWLGEEEADIRRFRDEGAFGTTG